MRDDIQADAVVKGACRPRPFSVYHVCHLSRFLLGFDIKGDPKKTVSRDLIELADKNLEGRCRMRRIETPVGLHHHEGQGLSHLPEACRRAAWELVLAERLTAAAKDMRSAGADVEVETQLVSNGIKHAVIGASRANPKQAPASAEVPHCFDILGQDGRNALAEEERFIAVAGHGKPGHKRLASIVGCSLLASLFRKIYL